MKIITVVVVALLFQVSGHDQVVWTEMPQSGDIPSVRGGAVAGIMDDTLVIFGGYLECFNVGACNNVFYSGTYHYDLYNNPAGKFTVIYPRIAPQPRAYHTLATYERANSLIIYGGTSFQPDFSQEVYFDDIWEYFPCTKTWVKRIPQNEGPGRRVGAGLAIRGHTLYLDSGYDGVTYITHNDLWSYDLRTNYWIQLRGDNAPNSHPPTYLHKLDRIDNYLYSFSGNVNPSALGVQNGGLWRLDLDELEWEQVPTPDSVLSRVHGGSAVTPRGIYYFLGDTNNDTEECQVNEISAGQLPTNRTDVFLFQGRNKGWRVKVPSINPPTLKRIAYANDDSYAYVLLGFNFTCAPDKLYNPETSLPDWNKKLFKLDLRSIY